jgi:hypothetical protein
MDDTMSELMVILLFSSGISWSLRVVLWFLFTCMLLCGDVNICRGGSGKGYC